MATIEEQLNHFAVKVNNGSGCIFQPDTTEYSYVLTVRHNVEKTHPPGSRQKVLCAIDEINVTRTNAYGRVNLNVRAVYTDAQKDIALLIVDYIGEYTDELMNAQPFRGEELRIYGFPSIAAGRTFNTENIVCTCDLVEDVDISYTLVAETTLHTFNHGAAINVIGFSGSGIFCIVGERLILKGIFPSLRLDDGALNKLNAFYINPFNALALANNLLELTPLGMCSFKPYENQVLNNTAPKIRGAVSPHVSKIVASPITPLAISNAVQGNLSVPYTKNYKDILNNPKLWKSWLELLTILDIVTDNPDYTLKTFLRNIKLYHSANKVAIEELIMELLRDQPSMDAVSDNDIVTFSSKATSANLYLSKARVKKIVGSIYTQGNDIPGIRIDKADKDKSFCCIDIEHFAQRIALIDTDLEIGDIKALIKEEILQILAYGNN